MTQWMTTEETTEAVAAGTHLRLSHSSMGVFASCARKFEFRKFYPESPREANFAADVGTALHQAYQHYLIHGDKEQAMMELVMVFPHKAAYTMPNDYGIVPTSLYDPKRDFWAAFSVLQEMMQESFIADFSLAEILDHKGDIVHAIEVPFEIHFPELRLGPKDKPITVSYIGFIDAIMQNKLTGIYRTVDIKTHRSTSRRRDAEFQFNGQQVPYGLVLQHILNRSVEQFEVHYFDCFVDLLSPRAENWVFKKDSIYMQEWMTNMILKLRSLDSYLKMNFFPRAEHGCLSYMKPCFYLNVCGRRDRDKILKLWHTPEKKSTRPPHQPWITCELDIPKESL